MANSRLSICLNLARVAATQYSSYNFKSMCKFGDKLLGANEDGIFVLDAADRDDGTDIPAYFMLGHTDFGAENEKRLRRLYISGRLEGRAKLLIYADDEDVLEQEMTPSADGLKLTHHSVSAGRDVRGKFLKLKVMNLGGSDFTVSQINAVLVVLGQQTKEGV